MKRYVISGALSDELKRSGIKLPKGGIVPQEDLPATLDYLQEHFPGKVEVAKGQYELEMYDVWLWYAFDGYDKASVPHREFITLEEHLAQEQARLLAPPPTPEHPAKQPNPNEID